MLALGRSEPGLALGRGQEGIVVVVSLCLPALLGPHRLTKNSVIQPLFSAGWKVANFHGFCGADFFKWNPCVWNSEINIYQNYSHS